MDDPFAPQFSPHSSADHRDDDLLSSIMHRNLAKLSPHANLQELVAHPAWQDYDALPVVNEAGRFLGVIRHRLVRKIERDLRAGMLRRSGWDMFFALGELYWIGLSAVCQGVLSAVAPTFSPPRPAEKEGTS